MWPTLPAPKQNFSWLGVELIRLAAKKIYLESSLSPTPSMQPRRYLIQSRIHIKSTLQLSLKNLGNSSPSVKEITLNSGSALVDSSGTFINPPTETQKSLTPYQYFRARSPGTSAKKLIATTVSTCGKWLFKYQMEKTNNSMILLTTT